HQSCTEQDRLAAMLMASLPVLFDQGFSSQVLNRSVHPNAFCSSRTRKASFTQCVVGSVRLAQKTGQISPPSAQISRPARVTAGEEEDRDRRGRRQMRSKEAFAYSRSTGCFCSVTETTGPAHRILMRFGIRGQRH